MLAVRVDLGRAAAIIAQVSLVPLLAAIGALAATCPAIALRWRAILSWETRAPGIATLLRIVFVGQFFNQVLPTGVGGDAVRVWRCRRLGVDLSVAIRSVLIDRACGYLLLVFLYAASLPALLRAFPDRSQQEGLALLFAAAVGGLLAFGLIDRLPARVLQWRLAAALAALSRSARGLLRDPARSVTVGTLSVATIGISILALELVGASVGADVSFFQWAMIFPPVFLIQLLPISLAGWGVREVALVTALAAFNVPPPTALAISVIFGLSQVVVGLPGSLIWFADWDMPREARKAARAKATGSPAEEGLTQFSAREPSL